MNSFSVGFGAGLVRFRGRVLVSTVLAGVLVVGCGGGGGGDSPQEPEAPQPQRLTAQIDLRDLGAAPLAGVTACLDLDGDLQCSAAEPSAVPDTQGALSLEAAAGVDLATLSIVVAVPQDGSGAVPAHVLAAQARPVTAVNTLTTLQRVQRGRVAAPADDLASYWKLAPGTALHDPQDAQAIRLNDIARPALLQLLAAATSGTPQTTAAAAPALIDALAGYIDAGSGTLLRTITPRVVATQALHALKPSGCEAAPVATLEIETAGQASIASKEQYVAATLRVSADGDQPAQQLPMRIRGRGNSTWEMPKKPYRLNLDQAASLLGMPADRHWALLAHYADKTLLRNSVAFCLSRMLALDYTPRHRYVELTLNGAYQGVYQLAEHIRVADHRVNLGASPAPGAESGMGFLLEVDQRLDADFGFSSTQGVPYAVKSDITQAQLPHIVGAVEAMESAMFGAEFRDPEQGYLRHLDVDTLIDVYLINELMRNNDMMVSSTYLYRATGGRLRFGPVWDFDITAGNFNASGNDAPEGWWVRVVSRYAQQLHNDEAFVQHLNARWRYLSSRMPELQAYIGAMALQLDAPQRRNFERWPILATWVWPNAVVTGSYEGEVTYLRGWLGARAGWMDAQMR